MILLLEVLWPAVKLRLLTRRSVRPQRGAMPPPEDALGGVRIVIFETRRADELTTMLERHGATVMRAPALREASLPRSPAALELARRLEAGEVDVVILLTGVGTRALAAAVADVCPEIGRASCREGVGLWGG